MYLKSLTILGFKSFVDKTTLRFMPGITAIVGPNGCGKSNVADAVRWVLGEQSAKALRGGEMADVIFNGTDKRKPLSLAEVSLTLGDVDEERLKAAGIELDYNEITISRRVYRDGAGEYFINKTQCRLKDIHQLFMGTGIGRSSYSIMAQGHITQVLSSRPDDRRLIFEEAAGITKFKSQKKEAIRKLEYTEQNLLRVSDLIREVKRQIGSLQRQAGKARRYKELTSQLQFLETQLARYRFDTMMLEIEGLENRFQENQRKIDELSRIISECEVRIKAERRRFAEIDHSISQKQQEQLNLKAQITNCENAIGFNEQRRSELDLQNANALSDITESTERLASSQNRLSELSNKFDASEKKSQELRIELERKQKSRQAADEKLRHLQDELSHAQSSAFEAAQSTGKSHNQINSLELRRKGNRTTLDKITSEKLQLEDEIYKNQEKLKQLRQELEKENDSLNELEAFVNEKVTGEVELQTEISSIDNDLDELLRKQTAVKSRLSVLEQLQAEHDGFSEGTLAALDKSPELLGVLVEKISVPDHYVPAVETALGHNIQAVITHKPKTADRIIEELKTNNKGRATIIALELTENSNTIGALLQNKDRIRNNRLEKEDKFKFLSLFSFACREFICAVDEEPEPDPINNQSQWKTIDNATHALSVIKADQSVQTILYGLLEKTQVVDSLQSAIDSWKQYPGEFDFVTLDGEFLSRHGVFNGGDTKNEGVITSILRRKNEIRSLKAELSDLDERISQVRDSKDVSTNKLAELKKSLVQEQSRLRDCEVNLASKQTECKTLENAVKVLTQKYDTVDFEIESLQKQEDSDDLELTELSREAAELNEKEEELKLRISEINSELEQGRAKREAALAAQNETNVALASEEQFIASTKQQVKQIQQRTTELEQLIHQRRNEIDNISKRKKQCDTEIEEAQNQIDSFSRDCEKTTSEITELMSQRSQAEKTLNTDDELLQTQRNNLAKFEKDLKSVELDLAQKNMSVENLKERINQKYQISLSDVQRQYFTVNTADSRCEDIAMLSLHEMEENELSTDWEIVTEKVGALTKRIQEMGAVNLVAIEEYEETEQRFSFLSEQYDDLIKAKEHLVEVINRINTQTREMFITTFNQVRENFSKLFTEIFGGGKADLVLSEGEDVLESGIEIVARPPGKQLKNISLLSGGEQTMTAVALLFAIYQVRPSPFCVLDELDAPLDESNINRFIKILKRFLKYSQFVIITHNKRTIATADIIYGVTMEESGVSKILSMKFQQIGHTPLTAQTTDKGFGTGQTQPNEERASNPNEFQQQSEPENQSHVIR
ncbi:MAG: chromosome segregation protein SMC [Verrucomicrobia bacterium]|nr:chromosome segregation protein SMC [Verrucomicrobiota bacterium]MCF7708011.1 chromosome segregation protein SMC [Verrucomicrobiota bacterium]